MGKYTIKTPDNDFKFLESNPNSKGSRVKKLVIDNNGKNAFFKYEGNGYLASEACSDVNVNIKMYKNGKITMYKKRNIICT